MPGKPMCHFPSCINYGPNLIVDTTDWRYLRFCDEHTQDAKNTVKTSFGRHSLARYDDPNGTQENRLLTARATPLFDGS